MQKSIKKALLRKFILDQCQKKNRNPLPAQALSLTTIILPTLHPEPKQIEISNSNQNNTPVNKRQHTLSS
jgi:hypothetical protein